MARQRITNRQELMKAAETLLLEKGYKGFHFKGLSEYLQIARSTIYEYYRNKDELIADYMKSLMEEIIGRCDKLNQIEHPLEKLKEMLVIFFDYSYIHQILQIRPFIEESPSDSIVKNLQILDRYHNELFSLIISFIEDAKNAHILRNDIPTIVIASILFSAIEIPNMTGQPQDLWADMLFNILLEGMEHR